MAADASQAAPTQTPRAPPARGAAPASLWAGSALVLTALVATIAKIAGVIVLPGLQGIAYEKTMEVADAVTGTLAYVSAGLLVALVCGGSFEIARQRRIAVAARASVVGLSGLIVALASPAVVTRLNAVAALALAIVTSVVALVGGIVALRSAHTRAGGALLVVLAACGLLRPLGWEAAALGGERASVVLFRAGTVLAAAAIVLHTFATLLAAAWVGTRSGWRGRVLANVAVLGAFVVTYVAARSDGDGGTVEALLHNALLQDGGGGVALPQSIAVLAAFLVPASILLAFAAVAQKGPPVVLAAIALALVSHGAFDVPLQSLAVVAAAQWLMLAGADERGMWAALVSQRAKPTEQTSGGRT